MKYKVGDRVKMHSLQWCKENIFNNEDKYPPELFGGIEKFCGKILTISDAVDKSKYVDEGYYNMFEDTKWDYYWSDEMIEGLVEEEVDLIPKFGEFSDNEPLDIPTMTTDFIKEHGLPCPDGYIFKDENGNVINTTKIVLEKKKKDVSLTQEQINTMIHDSCVLFCKHCGCGIPRDTCTSLGTCKQHDEYRATIRTYLMEKKKKEYPKTYEECCEALEYIPHTDDIIGYKWDILQSLQKLLICRDAYWKIAGEEMELGKPWEPDWSDTSIKYCLERDFDAINKNVSNYKGRTFSFPTEEMRDAFYENFKELINKCKELL